MKNRSFYLYTNNSILMDKSKLIPLYGLHDTYFVPKIFTSQSLRWCRLSLSNQLLFWITALSVVVIWWTLFITPPQGGNQSINSLTINNKISTWSHMVAAVGLWNQFIYSRPIPKLIKIRANNSTPLWISISLGVGSHILDIVNVMIKSNKFHMGVFLLYSENTDWCVNN